MAGFNAMLPEYKVSAVDPSLFFEPVQGAIKGYQEGVDKAAKQQRNLMVTGKLASGDYAGAMGATDDPSLALGIGNAQLHKQQFAQQQKMSALDYSSKLAHLYGGVAQMVDGERDPAKRQAMWGRVLQSHPEMAGALQQHGIDPNDHANGPKFLVAQAAGYRDPLQTQLHQSQLATQGLQRQALGLDIQSKQRELDSPSGKITVLPDGSRAVITNPRTGEHQVIDQGGIKSPPGYRPTQGGNLEAIPGGPADVKISEKRQQDFAALQSLSSNLDRLASSANQVLQHHGLAGNFGVRGAVPNFPGSNAADANALLHTLKTQSAFTTLQDMRNASKTGGALGAVSDRENAMLQDAIAALDKSQSVEQVRQNLGRIIEYTNAAKQRITATYNDHWNKGGAASGAEQSPAAGRAAIQDRKQLPSGKFAVKINGQWFEE